MKQLNSEFVSNVYNGSLSSFPSVDFVNPGIGNIVRPYGLYVPIHGQHEIYKKTKATPEKSEKVANPEKVVIQEGGGKGKHKICL